MTFDEFKNAATVTHWDHTQRGTTGSIGTDMTYGKFKISEYVTLERFKSSTRNKIYTISGRRTSATDFLTQLAEHTD
jgi:hypothetical protein